MPHITQLSAQEISSGATFNRYVTPKIPIEAGAEKATGIIWDGSILTVDGIPVNTVNITQAITDFLTWLQQFSDVLLVAHNGRTFDFRVLSYIVNKLDMQSVFLDHVVAFADSLSMFRTKIPKLPKYTQVFLAQHVCQESYNAHNAIDDVAMLCKILQKANICKEDFEKFSYASDVHFIQEVFNTAKSKNVASLHCIVAKGVVKMNMAENIAGSGLHLGHLRLIWQRNGEDGITNVFADKKTRVTSEKRTLGGIVTRLCEFFKSEKD